MLRQNELLLHQKTTINVVYFLYIKKNTSRFVGIALLQETLWQSRLAANE